MAWKKKRKLESVGKSVRHVYKNLEGGRGEHN
jgi:hypothetical protein